MLKYLILIAIAAGFACFHGTLNTSSPVKFAISLYEGASDAEDAVKKKIVAGIKAADDMPPTAPHE